MRMLNPSSSEVLDSDQSPRVKLSTRIGISPKELGEPVSASELKVGDYLLIDSPHSLITGQIVSLSRSSNGALSLGLAQPYGSHWLEPGEIYSDYYSPEKQINADQQISYYRIDPRAITREPNTIARLFGAKIKHYHQIPRVAEILEHSLESPTVTLDDAGRQIVIPAERGYSWKLTTISSVEEIDSRTQRETRITLPGGGHISVQRDSAQQEPWSILLPPGNRRSLEARAPLLR